MAGGIDVSLEAIRDFSNMVSDKQNELENSFSNAKYANDEVGRYVEELIKNLEEIIRRINSALEAVSYGLDECNRTRNYFKSIQLDQSSPDYYDKLQIIDNKLQANYNRECELYSRQSELYNRRDKVERKIDEVRQILKDTNLAYYDVEKRHKQLSKALDNAYQRSKESYNAASSLLKRLTGGEYNSGSHLKIDDFEAIIDFADNVQSRKEDMISLSEELNSALSLLQSSMQDKIVDNCSAVINDIENLSEGYFNYIEDVCGAYREAYNISKRYGN